MEATQNVPLAGRWKGICLNDFIWNARCRSSVVSCVGCVVVAVLLVMLFLAAHVILPASCLLASSPTPTTTACSLPEWRCTAFTGAIPGSDTSNKSAKVKTQPPLTPVRRLLWLTRASTQKNLNVNLYELPGKCLRFMKKILQLSRSPCVAGSQSRQPFQALVVPVPVVLLATSPYQLLDGVTTGSTEGILTVFESVKAPSAGLSYHIQLSYREYQHGESPRYLRTPACRTTLTHLQHSR